MNDRERRIVQLGEQGLNTVEIGREVGCSKVWAWKVLTRHGIGRFAARRERICSAEVLFPGAEYAGEEQRFLHACESYRQRHHKRFLHATDYLKVLKGMGYRRG